MFGNSPFLRTKLVSESEFLTHFATHGGVYFIKNDELDCVKIGYSREPWTRLSNLQVGSPSDLRIIGLVAASARIEPIIHGWHFQGRRRGEWFHDRGEITAWLKDITHGFPMMRNIWELVPGQEFVMAWDEEQKRHIKHVFNNETGQWEPPFK